MSEIGDALRERRMAERIDVHQVEDATKIRAKYLRALENEEFDLLPGPAYAKSFLRTYAEYLGLDSRQLLEVYRARYERGGEEHALFSGRIEVGTVGKTRRRVLLAVVVVILILAVLFVIGTVGGSSGNG